MPANTVNLSQPPFDGAKYGPLRQYESAALLFSNMAYPLEPKEQDKFWKALCASHLVTMAMAGRDAWTLSARPGYFVASETERNRVLLRGAERLVRRTIATAFIAMPRLELIRTGKKDTLFWNFKPTVENMAEKAMRCLGWKGEDSHSTFISRVWSPAKPVVHCFAFLWQCAGDGIGPMHVVYTLMASPREHLVQFVKFTEDYRLLFSAIPRFTIKEENTIKFVI
jgi:hypothetical protein